MRKPRVRFWVGREWAFGLGLVIVGTCRKSLPGNAPLLSITYQEKHLSKPSGHYYFGQIHKSMSYIIYPHLGSVYTHMEDKHISTNGSQVWGLSFSHNSCTAHCKTSSSPSWSILNSGIASNFLSFFLFSSTFSLGLFSTKFSLVTFLFVGFKARGS